MMHHKTFMQILIIFLIFKNSTSKRNFDVRWTRTLCASVNNIYVMSFICFSKDLPKHRGSALTAEVKFNMNINNSLVDLKVTMQIPGKSKPAELLKFRADGCKMTNHQTGNPVVNSMVKKMIAVGNVHKGCPLRGNLSYKMENFALNPDYFPSVTPEMNFTTTVNVFMGKVQLLHGIFDASIVKKKSGKT